MYQNIWLNTKKEHLKNMINRLILYLISVVFQSIVFVRNKLYDFKILPSIQSQKMVISIGNIELGGTGKTPFVIALIQQLIVHNMHPVVITRGYRRNTKHQIIFKYLSQYTAQEVGDEPYYIKYTNENIPIIIDHNKKRAIETANKIKKVDCIIMDDGFQSRYIDRNLDIVLINGWQKKEAFKIMPLGCLREPIQNVHRADYIYTTKGNQLTNELLPQNTLTKINTTFNLIKYEKGVIKSKQMHKIKDVNYKIAFCGIANGEHFIDSLNRLKISFDKKIIFKNHEIYNRQKIKMLTNGNKKNISFITTYKDFFKLNKKFITQYTIYVLEMNMELDNLELIEKIKKLNHEN